MNDFMNFINQGINLLKIRVIFIRQHLKMTTLAGAVKERKL